MGLKLTDSNPNVTDLSDRHRPTKLAEKYAELYDNQWTDAFDVLDKTFPSEENIINILLNILLVIKILEIKRQFFLNALFTCGKLFAFCF
jgi:hypothetical protein